MRSLSKPIPFMHPCMCVRVCLLCKGWAHLGRDSRAFRDSAAAGPLTMLGYYRPPMATKEGTLLQVGAGWLAWVLPRGTLFWEARRACGAHEIGVKGL